MWRSININISQDDMDNNLEKAGSIKIEHDEPEYLTPREQAKLV